MTEIRQAREVDLVPNELRFVPQVKSDIILQRRNVVLAPTEAASEYSRSGTNTITFNVQGHRDLSQLLDTKSMYFTWESCYQNGYPVEDVSMLVEEVIISSNGRTLERVRHAQFITHFLRGFGMSRDAKMKLGKREGFQRFEDRTVQQYQGGTDHGFAKGADTSGAGLADADAAGNSRKDGNLGYYKNQISRAANGAVAANVWGQYRLQKFKLACSGLLTSDKMLPIMSMPLTIQLRLSDPKRATDSSDGFKYMIRKPRMHINVCSVGQAYASAMVQRLRGPGITVNTRLFDTFFQIIDSDKMIVIPSNKQRLSKVYVMLLDNAAQNTGTQNAFRSSINSTLVHTDSLYNTGDPAQAAIPVRLAGVLQSYQFQVGTEVSEPVTLNKSSGDFGDPENTGLGFLEAYLRSIGAVNGHEKDIEYWGSDIHPLKCNEFEGGDLLKTFLSKYFVCCYDGEKILGSQIETGVDTESGKDIVINLQFKDAKAGPDGHKCRAMVLMQYHAQMIIKENDVQLSF